LVPVSLHDSLPICDVGDDVDDVCDVGDDVGAKHLHQCRLPNRYNRPQMLRPYGITPRHRGIAISK
jgi:hypothetical protein